MYNYQLNKKNNTSNTSETYLKRCAKMFYIQNIICNLFHNKMYIIYILYDNATFLLFYLLKKSKYYLRSLNRYYIKLFLTKV